MTHDRWTDNFFRHALLASEMSRDSTKVGAIIVDDRNRIVSSGYNGPPAGVNLPFLVTSDRKKKLICTIHAEENALAFAWRDVKGMTLFCTRRPCGKCAAMMVQRGIDTVAYLTREGDTINPDWEISFAIADMLFQQAGVEVYEFFYTSDGEIVNNEEVPF